MCTCADPPGWWRPRGSVPSPPGCPKSGSARSSSLPVAMGSRTRSADAFERDVERTMACFDRAAFRDLLVEMIEVPSPTGDEAPLARVLAQRLADFGLDARVQPLDDRQANAVGHLRSSVTDGPELLL